MKLKKLYELPRVELLNLSGLNLLNEGSKHDAEFLNPEEYPEDWGV